jgi:methylated-DNA-[protein]-cysteine S-methyltransferase
VLPCHRVVGSTGALTGYGGGLDRKRALLELEGALSGRTGQAATASFGRRRKRTP